MHNVLILVEAWSSQSNSRLLWCSRPRARAVGTHCFLSPDQGPTVHALSLCGAEALAPEPHLQVEARMVIDKHMLINEQDDQM